VSNQGRQSAPDLATGRSAGRGASNGSQPQYSTLAEAALAYAQLTTTVALT